MTKDNHGTFMVVDSKARPDLKTTKDALCSNSLLDIVTSKMSVSSALCKLVNVDQTCNRSFLKHYVESVNNQHEEQQREGSP